MPLPDAVPPPEDFAAFLALSARLGRDIRRTQGAGGNTSIKQDGVMWVKASGTWLAEAEARPITVPVRLEPLARALRENDPRAETAVDFVLAEGNAAGLRPSIETSFHAVLPQRVVAHFHCVDTIALAVRADREALIAERLDALPGLAWTSVPYRRPGTPLARAIDERMGERPDVLVLFNHGLVVCGESVEEVAARIEAVTAALAVPPAPAPAPDRAALEALAAGSPWQPAEEDAAHAPALVPAALRFATAGAFYPDHVIFLGERVGVAEDRAGLDRLAAEAEPPRLVLVPGRGVLQSRTLTPGGAAMVRCLAEVARRVPAEAPLVPLGPADLHALLNWEAEQYRQTLDRAAPQAAAR